VCEAGPIVVAVRGAGCSLRETRFFAWPAVNSSSSSAPIARGDELALRRAAQEIIEEEESKQHLAEYISRVDDIGAIYGTFAGAIVLVGWMWITNVALLFGAELNAEIERGAELGEGVPESQTLNRPARRG
jgi:hypothetical protein